MLPRFLLKGNTLDSSAHKGPVLHCKAFIDIDVHGQGLSPEVCRGKRVCNGIEHVIILACGAILRGYGFPEKMFQKRPEPPLYRTGLGEKRYLKRAAPFLAHPDYGCVALNGIFTPEFLPSFVVKFKFRNVRV